MGAGTVLSQEHEGNLHPIAYVSKLFNKAERAYSASKRELAAVVWAVRHFHVYLQGYTFALQCNHGALSFLTKSIRPNARLQRWALTLSGYSFDVQYVPGSKMGHADALSRIQDTTYENSKADPTSEYNTGTLASVAESMAVAKGNTECQTVNQNEWLPEVFFCYCASSTYS